MRSASPFWKQLCGIDLRTLALFRVALAIAVMADLVNLWPDISAFLDDQSLFPRTDAVLWVSPYVWSLYFINGHVAWAYALLLATWLAALAMFIGYHTRLAAIVCWILIASLSTRISIVNSGADTQLSLFLFWAMFLPLGARFSVDAALSRRPKGENPYVSWATLAIMLQVAYLYFFGALLKIGPAWRETFDAIYYVLNTPDYTSALAPYVPPWTEALRWLTWYVYYLEFLAIFVLFSPVRNALCRLAILPLLITLHVGFALLLAIGFFPAVSIAGLMVFVPGLLWDRLLPWFNARPGRAGIKIWYDRDCGFCRKTCLIFRELGLPPETPVRPAQENPEIYAIMQRDNSWVVEDGAGNRRTRWEAVAWVWRRSPILWPLGALFLPRFMRPAGDAVYEWIATHRGELGRLTVRLLPEHERNLAFRLSRPVGCCVAVLAALVLVWNIQSLHSRPLGNMPPLVVNTMNALKLKQHMGFFAPNSHTVARWVVIEGHLADGTIIDLLNRRLAPSPLHRRLTHGYAAYPSHRWNLLFTRLNFNKSGLLLGRHFCSVGEDILPFGRPPIKEMAFTVYRQFTPPPGMLPEVPPPPVIKLFDFKYDCLRKRVVPVKAEKPAEKNDKAGKAPLQ